jgi:hypothetical protein
MARAGSAVLGQRAHAHFGAYFETAEMIFAALRRYDEFDADNGPYGEHDSAGSPSVVTTFHSRSTITTVIGEEPNPVGDIRTIAPL